MTVGDRETMTVVDGPYFDELHVGQAFDDAPAVTLTTGLAAVHQSILGDRLRLPLETRLSRLVTGYDAPLANPALVWNLAIGQSTIATRQVRANLFYRGLTFHRHPVIGDSLHTTTRVAALRQNSRKPPKAPTGMAVLRITTEDQFGRVVLDFFRCAMLPLRHPPGPTGFRDDLDGVGTQPASPRPPVPRWDLAAFGRALPAGAHFTDLSPGQRLELRGGDVVSSAPELARLTLNIATVHHDEHATDAGRLVYGGHTIGVALAQATRMLPNIVTVVGWESCDHLGPVREGDTLYSSLKVAAVEPRPQGGGLVHLRSGVHVANSEGARQTVLDWRFTALMA
jgi:acyl dehydratase